MFLFGSCVGVSYERAFLAKYEFEDFSQFKGVDMAFRGTDKHGNLGVFGYAPQLINDYSKVGYYILILDRENYQVIETRLARTEFSADTIKLQLLARTFIEYEIPRLKVDTQGNVFVYLKNFETLALARFADSDLPKYPHKWVEIGNNWYKPK